MEDEKEMEPTVINAFDIPDAWYQCLHKIIKDPVFEYPITRGSYKGQKRREFDFVVVKIDKPGNRPLCPIIPEGSSIPPPTNQEYLDKYLYYLLTDEKHEGEDYTYGERLVNPKARINGEEIPFGVNPLEELVKMYNQGGYGTNQATLEIAMPSDITLNDPPCCRLIDTRVRYGKLHFFTYFRSWDLWAGFPSNLGGIQLMKEHIAERIGVKDGKIIAASKGLHLYDYAWQLAEALTQKQKTEMKID